MEAMQNANECDLAAQIEQQAEALDKTAHEMHVEAEHLKHESEGLEKAAERAEREAIDLKAEAEELKHRKPVPCRPVPPPRVHSWSR